MKFINVKQNKDVFGDGIHDDTKALQASIDELTKLIWENLNEDNKVSLFVRYIDLENGAYESRIVNKNK